MTKRIAVLLLLLAPVFVAAAQEKPVQLILRAGQTLYRWDGQALNPIAELPAELYGSSLSPAGSYLVYRVQSEAYADEIARECPCGGLVMPTDLYLVDLQTGQTRLIAGQPEGAALSTGAVHSMPVWSPEGLRLAWVRGVDGGDLLVYDIADGSTQSIAGDLPSQTLVPSPIQLSVWTRSGIMLAVADYEETLSDLTRYRFYAADGTLLSETQPVPREPLNALILMDEGRDGFAVQTLTGWTLFDIATGRTETLSGGTIYAFSSSDPAASMRVGPRLLDAEGIGRWQVITPDGQTGLLPAPFRPGFIMGGSAAVVDRVQDQLWLWSLAQGSYTVSLPIIPDMIYMEHTHYELLREGETVRFGTMCEGGLLPIRLTLGAAWVVGESPAAVHENADPDSAQVGSIPAGDWFYPISSGPDCRDGLAWWQVDYEGLQGWAAEGSGTSYSLAPGCPPTGCGRG